MISDTISKAIHEIEDDQRRRPEAYMHNADHIEVAKKVLASLMNELDEPPTGHPLILAAHLTSTEQERWRVTCEANIARWVG